MNANDDLKSRFTKDAKDRFVSIRDAAGDIAGEVALDAAIQGSIELVRSQAHMIKGAAGMLDFDEVKSAAAQLEDVAAQAIESGGELAGNALSVAIDGLGDALSGL